MISQESRRNYTYDKIYELMQVTQGTNTTENYNFDPVENGIGDNNEHDWKRTWKKLWLQLIARMQSGLLPQSLPVQ